MTRQGRWASAGALLGFALAVLSLYDMSHYEGDWVFPSSFEFAICPTILLALALPAHTPRPIADIIFVCFNACLFAIPLWFMGVLFNPGENRFDHVTAGDPK